MKKLFYSFVVAMVCVAATGCGSNSSKSAEGTEVTSSSNDIDAFLDAYEDAMNTCVEVAQKANSGDESAMLELTNAQAKLADAASKLSDSKDEMTDAQAQRMAEIAAKAAQAGM